MGGGQNCTGAVEDTYQLVFLGREGLNRSIGVQADFSERVIVADRTAKEPTEIHGNVVFLRAAEIDHARDGITEVAHVSTPEIAHACPWRRTVFAVRSSNP